MNQDIRLSREQRRSAIVRLVDTMRAAQTASDVMDEAFVDFLGINRNDGRCLDVIERRGEVTAGELAAEVGLTTGAVTTMIDRLAAGGLVQRRGDPADRRKVLVGLTSQAKRLAAEVYGEMAHAAAPYMDQLSDRDLLTLIAFFEVSRSVNLELAETVRKRTGKRTVSLRYRLEQAKELKNDAKALFKTMKSEMKDWVKVVVVTGDDEWARDESGNWAQVRSRDEG